MISILYTTRRDLKYSGRDFKYSGNYLKSRISCIPGDTYISSQSKSHLRSARDIRWDLYQQMVRLSIMYELSYDNFEEYTCTNCSDTSFCLFAYDGYNTNGDCLAEK